MNLFQWFRKERALRAAGRLARRGNVASALDRINAALADSPAAVDLHIQKAWALADLKHYDEAEAAVTAALKIHPENGILHMIHGEILSAQNRYPESKDVLHLALDLAGDNLRIEHALGLAYVALGDMEKAAQYLESSVRYDKSLVAARLLAMAERYLFEHRPS